MVTENRGDGNGAVSTSPLIVTSARARYFLREPRHCAVLASQEMPGEPARPGSRSVRVAHDGLAGPSYGSEDVCLEEEGHDFVTVPFC